MEGAGVGYCTESGADKRAQAEKRFPAGRQKSAAQDGIQADRATSEEAGNDSSGSHPLLGAAVCKEARVGGSGLVAVSGAVSGRVGLRVLTGLGF